MKQPVTIEAHAFNIAYPTLTNALVSEVHITSAFDPSHPPSDSEAKKYLAIWDTGATNSVITQKVVQDCALMPIAVAKVNTANGEVLSNVYLVGIWLPNKVRIAQVRVTEGLISGGVEVLIGMDIICMGDFAVTNKDGRTNFTFRTPSLECLDFVKQKPALFQSGTQKLHNVGRNEPCPCGSGKKYKKCCGLGG